ncbi:MAG: protein kinase [Planctomycetes bacterium]|nr:protein kinase [Planctomycetota bacterium]
MPDPSRDSDDPQSWLRRADALARERDWEGSLLAYDRVLAHSPRHTSALQNRGVVLVKLARLREAIASFRKVLELDPGNAPAARALEKAIGKLARTQAPSIERLSTASTSGTGTTPSPSTVHAPSASPAVLSPAGGATTSTAGPVVHGETDTAALTEASRTQSSGGDSGGTGGTGASAGTGVAPRAGRRHRTKAAGIWSPGDVVLGKYEVLRELGQGGMGVVYQVFHREWKMDLVVKCPLPDPRLDREAELLREARYVREAEAWVALGKHPNVVTALYVLKIDAHPRLFIEYIDGGNLRRRIKADKLRELPGILDLAIQMARGMAHAHRVGLIHRDLKPENCLLTADGELKVTDFGSAAFQAAEGPPPSEAEPAAEGEGWRLDPELVRILGPASSWKTLTRGGLGTPAYMAPEQWNDAHAVGKPADVYAFGVTFFEMVCGRRPFLTDKHSHLPVGVHLGLKHLREEPPSPTSLRPDLPHEVAQVITRCLEKDPRRRYGTFDEIEHQLLALFVKLTGEPYPRPEVESLRLRATDLNNRALSLFDLGHPAEALACLEEAHQADPGAATILLNLLLGRCAQQSRSATGRRLLLEAVDNAARSHERDERFPHLRAWLLASWGDAASAVPLLEQAVRLAARPAPLREELACARLLAGDLPAARASLEELARAREGAGARTFRALAALHVQQGNAEAALAALAREAALSPRDPDPVVDRALLRGVERTPQAREDAEQAVERDPLSLRALLHAAGGLLAARPPNWQARLQPILGRLRGPIADLGAVGRILEQAALAGVVVPAGAGAQEAVHRPPAPFPPGAVQRAKSLLFPSPATVATLSGDGRQLVLANARYELFFRELDGDGGWRPLGRASGAVEGLCLSARGEVVAWTAADGSVSVGAGGRVAACPSLARPGREGPGSGPLALSADGQRLARGGEDGRILLLERATGSTREARSDAGPIKTLAFSADGRFLLSGGQDGALRLWDAATAAPVGVFQEAGTPLTAAQLGAEGRLALAGDEAGGAAAWDLHGSEVAALLPPSGSEATSLAWLDSVRAVAIGHADGSVCLWDPSSSSVLQVLEGNGCPVLALRFRPGPRPGHGPAPAGAETRRASLAAIGGRGVLLWSLPSDDLAYPRTAPPLAPLHLAVEQAQSTAQTRATTHRFDDLLEEARREAAAGDLGRSWSLIEEAGRLQGFEREGRLLALRTQVGLRLRPVGIRSHWGRHRLEGHSKEALAIAVAPDGRGFASGGADWLVRTWDLETGAPEAVLREHAETVVGVAVSPDGQLLASAGANGEVLVWDGGSGQLLRRLARGSGAAARVTFSGDGQFLVVGTEDGQIEIWEPVSGSPVVRSRTAAAVTSIAASPDGAYLLVGTQDGVVQLWEVATGCPLHPLPIPGSRRVVAAFAEAGAVAVGAGDNGLLLSWWIDTGQRRPDVRFESGVRTAFSRDGRFLLTGGGREFRLCDVAQGKTLRVLGPCPGEVCSLALTVDLRYALAGLADGVVDVWELEWEYAGVGEGSPQGAPL